MSMKTSPFKVKQKLSKEAAIKKKKRDVSMAKSKRRTAMRAQNQRIGQRSDSDLHHIDGTPGGPVRRVSIAKNRGGFGKGTK